MTNEMQIFKHSEFGELGTIEIDGKTYFPATQCAKVLGYAVPRKAISDHCKGHGVLKRNAWVQTGFKKDGTPAMRENEINFIDEGNLYRLIVHSKLPSAEKFERWVFDEVLPAIRKTGQYAFGSTNVVVGLSDLKELIAETVRETTVSILKEIVPAITHAVVAAVKEAAPAVSEDARFDIDAYSGGITFSPGNMCKLDTFPEDIKEQVDFMLDMMREQQAVNFSQVARFCTMNGHPISSPAVKRYFTNRYPDKRNTKFSRAGYQL